MAKKSSKAILITVLSVVGALIVAGVVFSLCYKPYMAVYLTTGDIYFGKTSVFPCVKIQDPWFLQRGDDGSLSLEKFSDAVWAPKGGMKVSRDQIVFTSKLSELSPVVAAIEGRGVPQQQIEEPQDSGEEDVNLEEVLDSEDLTEE